MSEQSSTKSPWWKRTFLRLPTWAWIAIVLALVAIAAASGGGDDAASKPAEAGTPGTTSQTQQCDDVSEAVRTIGDGIEIDEWFQLPIEPSPTGGYNTVVQGRGPGGRYTWAVDQEGGTVTGLTASMDQVTADASGFPLATGDSPAAKALEEVLSQPQATTINDCA